MDTKQLANEIKQRMDLVEYVSREVILQRSGKSLRGRCPHPDHLDTNPSFVVGVNHHGDLVASCFGCGKTSMDIIGYVQWRQNIDFSEAISLLADELGWNTSLPAQQIRTQCSSTLWPSANNACANRPPPWRV